MISRRIVESVVLLLLFICVYIYKAMGTGRRISTASRDYAESDRLRAWLEEQNVKVVDKTHTFRNSA